MDPCEFTKSSCHSWELMLTGRTHSATTNRGTWADWQRLYTECDVFIMVWSVFIWTTMGRIVYLGGHCIALAGLFSFATIVYWISSFSFGLECLHFEIILQVTALHLRAFSHWIEGPQRLNCGQLWSICVLLNHVIGHLTARASSNNT